MKTRHSTPDTRSVLEPHLERVTWDAPIGSLDDLAALPVRPSYVNVKPSRLGTLASLLDVCDHLAAEGIRAYGGGQFELGPGRGQIQYLASVFHPDAPNDVAPLGYHEVRPPSLQPARTGATRNSSSSSSRRENDSTVYSPASPSTLPAAWKPS